MSHLNLMPITRVDNVTQAEFHHAYRNPLRPVIIKNLAASWPALRKWTPQFFTENYGDKLVKVYNTSFAAPGQTYMSNAKTLALKDYLDVVMNRSMDLRMFLYNLKKEMPELAKDIDFPAITKGFSKNFIFMFFGCKGSVTQMHFDIDMAHVFHTPIQGKKTVTLFPYEEAEHLYRHPFTCRSYVDVHNPDFTQFPLLKHAKGYQCVLEPGETLFMPGGYWHHIVYDEPGFAVSLRCSHQSYLARLHGYYNFFVMSRVDRVMNKLFSEKWYRWKERAAHSAGLQVPNHNEIEPSLSHETLPPSASSQDTNRVSYSSHRT